LVDLIWYFTDLPFIESETVVNNRTWDSDDTRDLVTGELFGAEKKYNGLWSIPGMTGEHICGTAEEFAQGQPWPYTGTPRQYDPDNIPVCCGRANFARVGVSMRPAATSFASMFATARAGMSLRPAATSFASMFATARAGMSLRPSNEASLTCDTYSFVCSGVTVTLTNVFPDGQWSGVGPLGVVWRLTNHRAAPIIPAGNWVLSSSPSFGQFGATGWNGRGAKTFTRTGFFGGCAGNPPTMVVTGSCS